MAILANSTVRQGLLSEPLKIEPSMTRAGGPNRFGEAGTEGTFKSFKYRGVDLVTTGPCMGTNGRPQIRETPFR